MLCQRQYEEERPGLRQKARNLTLTRLVDCAVNHLFNFYLLRVRLKSKQPLLAVFLEINLAPGCLKRGPPSVRLSGPSLPVPTLFSPPLSPHLVLHCGGRDPEGCGISRQSPPMAGPPGPRTAAQPSLPGFPLCPQWPVSHPHAPVYWLLEFSGFLSDSCSLLGIFLQVLTWQSWWHHLFDRGCERFLFFLSMNVTCLDQRASGNWWLWVNDSVNISSVGAGVTLMFSEVARSELLSCTVLDTLTRYLLLIPFKNERLTRICYFSGRINKISYLHTHAHTRRSVFEAFLIDHSSCFSTVSDFASWVTLVTSSGVLWSGCGRAVPLASNGWRSSTQCNPHTESQFSPNISITEI